MNSSKFSWELSDDEYESNFYGEERKEEKERERKEEEMNSKEENEREIKILNELTECNLIMVNLIMVYKMPHLKLNLIDNLDS
jgi:hypothetical protein